MNDPMANGSGSDSAEDACRRDTADRPGLPYAKAFVVQFTAETDARLEHAGGRVEHLQSGARARFASAADLLACIAALLADERKEPGGQVGPRARRGWRSRTAPGAGAGPPSA